MNIRLFISEVKKRRALWDRSNTNYHNKKVLGEKWREIARIFDIEVHTAKQKWKNLRDTFRVELKKLRKYNGNESGDFNAKSQWAHYEDMLFIKDILKTRKLRRLMEPTIFTGENPNERVKIERDMAFSPLPLTDPNTIENNSTIIIENVTSLQPQFQDVNNLTKNVEINHQKEKIKRSSDDDEDLENNDEDQDDDLLFFRSLLPFVKKLDQDKRLLFRMNVQQMLYNQLYNNN